MKRFPLLNRSVRALRIRALPSPAFSVRERDGMANRLVHQSLEEVAPPEFGTLVHVTAARYNELHRPFPSQSTDDA
jgi:hypothetical protein